MKGQNFGFMTELAPLIISKQKRLTNRKATEFRKRLEAGGTMHMFTGLRTKNSVKLGDAMIIEISEWNTEQIPDEISDAETRISPISPLTWVQFSIIDGFETYEKFKDFFSGKGDMICYYWSQTFEPVKESKFKTIPLESFIIHGG